MTSVYEVGREHIFQEVDDIHASIIDQRSAQIRLIAQTVAAKLRAVITEKVIENLLPANTEEYTGTLPLGTRFHRRVKDTTILVVEQTPTKRTVRMSPDVFVKPETWSRRGMKALRPYCLAFPYIVFVFRFNWFVGDGERDKNMSRHFDEPRVWVFYRNRPLESENDMLFHTNLPNIARSDAEVCMGQTLDHFEMADFSDINKYTDKYLGRFWGRGFNCDHQNNFDYLAYKYPDYFSTLRKWQVASKKNANFVLGINYLKWGRLERVYDHELRRGQEKLKKKCAQQIHTALQCWDGFEAEVGEALEDNVLSRRVFRDIMLKIWRKTAHKIEANLDVDSNR